MLSNAMGRPKKRPEQIKRNQLKSMLTDADAAIIGRAADLAGIPKSVYIRTRLIAAAKADVNRLTR